MSTTDTIRFLASFPGNQSDIKLGKDGMRITLDVPVTEIANALPLVRLTECALRVTVEEYAMQGAAHEQE